MTQEEKDLLLKDICARLPYGVEVEYNNCKCELLSIDKDDEELTIRICPGYRPVVKLEEVKPYLFPLSNMTEEQYKEWGDLAGEPLDEILTRNAKDEIMSTLEHHLLVAKSSIDPVNYCYKNHFDIYGFIPKGLAIDATGLNIY